MMIDVLTAKVVIVVGNSNNNSHYISKNLTLTLNLH